MLVVSCVSTYVVVCVCFFFFKQKTAYEMLRSLVGSEMCIRDRHNGLGYLLGYLAARLTKQPVRTARTISIEVGMQLSLIHI